MLLEIGVFAAEVGVILLAMLVGMLLAIPSSTLLGGRHIARAASPIQRVVFIMKENHTFDSLFGTFPGANGATTGQIKVNGTVSTIPLNPPQNVPSNFIHAFSNAATDYDNGAMDMFNVGEGSLCSSPPYACYQSGIQSLIPNYWSLAQHFVLSDNAWSDFRGPSFSNHLYMMSGSSGPDIQHSVVQGPGGASWGCDSPSTSRAKLVDGEMVFPCFTFSTLADEMTAANVPWKYYAPTKGQSRYHWNADDYYNQIRNNASIWTTHDVPWQ